MTVAPMRRKQLTRRAAMALAIGGVVLFVAVAAFAYFSAGGTGTGSSFTETMSAPVIDPAGSPSFDLTNLVPGDSVPQSLTVQTPGPGPTPSKLSLYEVNPTGTLLPGLRLKIVEDSSTVIYDGPLASGWTAGAPLAIAGTQGSLWGAGETHHFVFTASIPLTAGNEFQATNATVSFVWLRTEGA
jgi:hypothetical protein